MFRDITINSNNCSALRRPIMCDLSLPLPLQCFWLACRPSTWTRRMVCPSVVLWRTCLATQSSSFITAKGSGELKFKVHNMKDQKLQSLEKKVSILKCS